ncbi:MAG TPA: hypothetical protein PLC17_12870 [Tenuifilaceae bacterium]|mgnify:FL=1|jgi:hypothetical protein|nr:hypothetical protein [Tenuifilaceae bacterium]HPX06824.1 hypothetical protein [Tenuifilaceae bacterium]HQB77984.1 hypothetical protein [Tenuifilaceae bacterium]
MASQKISERKVLLYTILFLVFAGLVRLANYRVGIVLFYLGFVPFLFYRINYYLTHRSKPKEKVDKYRLYLLVGLVITIVLNILGWQEADFFLLFLLMVDFLLVINKKW